MTPHTATPEDPPRWRWGRLLMLAMAALLLSAACWYVGTGMYKLTVSTAVRPPIIGPPIDLRLRWVEMGYIVRGQNPFDNYIVNEYEGPVVAPLSRDREKVATERKLGVVKRAAYPPWAYVTGAPIWLLPWKAARFAAAAANALALAVIAAWAYRKARPLGQPQALLLATVALALANYYTIIMLGQVTLYVLAFLVAAEWTAERRWDLASGLLMGLAMLKPTIAAPFFLVYLVRGRWLAVASCLGYLLASSLLIGWLAGANPLLMLQQMFAIAEQIEMKKGLAPGPITWLMFAGIDTKLAARASALVVLTACTVALWILRRRPVEQLFALASLAAVTWTHHKPYDEVVSLLLIVPLAALALRRPGELSIAVPALASALLALHGSLTGWIPKHPLAAVQLLVWTVGLIVLIRARRPEPDETGATPASASEAAVEPAAASA